MLIENNGDLMADDNEKTNGEGREYLGICALWKSGKMLVSQNIRKRLDKDSGTSLTDDDYKKDENQVRLIVMTNQFKSNDLLKDGAWWVEYKRSKMLLPRMIYIPKWNKCVS